MKILFLALDINLENMTGDSIHVRELATSLAKLGNEVFLITAYTNEYSNLGWTKKTPNLHVFFNRVKPGFRNISTFIHCQKIANKYHVQIIYERRNSPKIGVILSRTLGIPAIIECNGLPGMEAEMLRGVQKRKTIIWPIRSLISRFLFRTIDGVVAVTQGIKREIIQNYHIRSDKVFVIHNGANLDLFKPIEQDLCKEKFDLNQENKYVCFIGNLAPWQGVEYLIKASPLIVKEDIKTRFLIVGDGVMAETLRRMVEDINMKDKFNFLGKVPYEQVPDLINASAICVAPFIRKRNERIGLSPLKIYEYLACGKPVVASDIEGVGDFLRETRSGIAVEPENHDRLAKGIIGLLQNEDMSKEMGRNGRIIVTREHSWDSVAEKVIKVCKLLTYSQTRSQR